MKVERINYKKKSPEIKIHLDLEEAKTLIEVLKHCKFPVDSRLASEIMMSYTLLNNISDKIQSQK